MPALGIRHGLNQVIHTGIPWHAERRPRVHASSISQRLDPSIKISKSLIAVLIGPRLLLRPGSAECHQVGTPLSVCFKVAWTHEKSGFVKAYLRRLEAGMIDELLRHSPERAPSELSPCAPGQARQRPKTINQTTAATQNNMSRSFHIYANTPVYLSEAQLLAQHRPTYFYIMSREPRLCQS
ncbi:unnamed protein product [Pleuronectes platessa]|uniref:Uncharacterized protein n=1 Tax=Pleuronectes platessa TaxID=8262 RepID=A0A9N7U3P5_PLEPL|nr:unnamed protein product [Pleuronectes platessa]